MEIEDEDDVMATVFDDEETEESEDWLDCDKESIFGGSDCLRVT